MPDDFRYDIAFSFCNQDKPLVDTWTDALMDQFRVFHYARRQVELIGTDGEVSFTNVFRRDALLCVILHRAGWGTTQMTRVELEAIRGRAATEGYDFTVWIKLDDAPIPEYVAPRFIYGDFQHYGTLACAAAIAARAIDRGAKETILTAVDRAKRRQRAIERERERELFLSSNAGAIAASSAIERLRAELLRLVEEMQRDAGSLSAAMPTHNAARFAVCVERISASFDWQQPRSNVLREACLSVRYWPFRISFGGPNPNRKHSLEVSYLPESDGDGGVSWVTRDNRDMMLSSESLADHVVAELIKGSHR